MSSKALNEHYEETSGNVAAEQPTNLKFIETIDPEDPDYRRELQRPADVKEDMRQMESRQRVSSILNSQAFREELESIIADQLKHGPHPASLIALQQISELLLPNTNSRWHQVSSMGKGGSVLVPINDIRGIDTLNYAKGERLLRCKLASLFRIIDLYGWTSGISNQVTVRVNQDLEQFLVNPFGLLFHEVTASSLIKVATGGDVIEPGSSTYSVNKHGFSLHSAIYKARPDIRCIVHLTNQTAVSISSMKCGLLPISQQAFLCAPVSYHEFKGVLLEEDIRKLLAEDLGPINKVLIIRNFGIVACGESVEEACYYLLNVMAAAEIQTKALVGGLENVYIPSAETQRRLAEMGRAPVESLVLMENKKWKVGEMEFEAIMRCLDNAGYRTGYMYRQPIIRSIDRSAVKEVEIPPAATSCSLDLEYIKKLKEEKQKGTKSEWLNTPNVYARTEMEETGTSHPKKITKWVPESSPSKTSTSIKIESKHQFAPQGADPKELKNQQKQIKQDRMEDKKSAGYQSKLLANLEDEEESAVEAEKTDESAEMSLNRGQNLKVKQKYYEDTVNAGPESKLLAVHKEEVSNENEQSNGVNNSATTTTTTTTTMGATIIYGAASKGIIKRDQQNNAVVYKTYYAAANPFQQMGADEIEKYKKEVAQKQMKEQEDQLSDNLNSTGHTSGSHASSREPSPTRSVPAASNNDKSNSAAEISQKLINVVVSPTGHGSSSVINGAAQIQKSADQMNKSATMPHSSTASVHTPEKEKPKKKSKLSFLSRKKSKDQSSVQSSN